MLHHISVQSIFLLYSGVQYNSVWFITIWDGTGHRKTDKEKHSMGVMPLIKFRRLHDRHCSIRYDAKQKGGYYIDIFFLLQALAVFPKIGYPEIIMDPKKLNARYKDVSMSFSKVSIDFIQSILSNSNSCNSNFCQFEQNFHLEVVIFKKAWTSLR